MRRPGTRKVVLHGLWVLPCLLAVTSLVSEIECAALDHPYSKTEHGGRDANNDGTTGAQRDPNQPTAGYTVDPAVFPPGDCIHCHDQHSSLKNIAHAANPALLFLTPENLLCASCHDKPNSSSFNMSRFAGWAGTQRTATFAAGKHGRSVGGAQWVVGSSYNGIANVLNNNLTTPGVPPGAAKTYNSGSCLSCHAAHGYNPGAGNTALMTPAEQTFGAITNMLVRTVGSQTGASPAEANAMCNYCHDNNQLFPTGSDHGLASKSYWYKGNVGPSTTYPGYATTLHKTSTHAYNLWPGNGSYPARTGEKGLCLNCHDPHGGAPGGNINGAAGGAATSNRGLVAPMIDPSTATSRNALCYSCHNNIAGAGYQTFHGQALYESVKHGTSANAWYGQTTDFYNSSATSYNASTAFWGARSSGDYGLCVNCHNPHTKTVGSVSIGGSTTMPWMLLNYYNGSNTAQIPYAANNQALCFDCHNVTRLTTSGSNATSFLRSGTTGNLHQLHISTAQATCRQCHNPHSYNAAQVAGLPPAGARNISFPTALVTASGASSTINGVSTRGPVWYYDATVDGNTHQYGCLLTCHGEDHSPNNYRPAGRAAATTNLRVSATPSPAPPGAAVRIALHVPGSAAPTDGVEYSVDLPRSDRAVSVRPAALAASVGRAPVGSSSDSAFELPMKDWGQRSSHSVYVRTKGGAGIQPSWVGTMVGVLPAGADVPAVGYYRDAEGTEPVGTPAGTPVLPRQGMVHLRVVGRDVRNLRLSIDAPGDLNDVQNAPLSPAPDGEATYAWGVSEADDTPGRVRVTLTTPDGKVLIPGAGAFANIGDAPVPRAFVEATTTPDILDADGRASARVSVHVTDANGLALPSRTIEYRRLAGGGSIVPVSPVTDSTGLSEATYLAGITAETAQFEIIDRASGESVRTFVRLRLTSSVSITLVDAAARHRNPGVDETPTVTLRAFPGRLPADGVSTANVFGTVTDSRGLPKAGVRVLFEVAGDNGTVISTRPVSDAAGTVEAVYVAGRTPGDITVVARDLMGGALATASITLTTSGAARITLQATPDLLDADGRSMAFIVARVTDLMGRPVPGAAVQLRVHSGLGAIASGDTTTNPLGEVRGVFRTGSLAGVETVTATVLSPLPDAMNVAGATRDPAGRTGASGTGAIAGATRAAGAGSGGLAGVAGWASRASSAVLTGPVGRVVDNLAVGYGRWDEFLQLEGPQVVDRSLHLHAESWNLRFKKPLALGLGGLSLVFSMDNNEAQQYGWLSSYNTISTILRGSGRYYDVLGSFTQNRTDSEDLHTGLRMSGSSNDSLFGVTLRPPGLPNVNVTQYRASYRNGFGDSAYGVGMKSTTVTLFKQFGPLGVQWTNTDASQDQGTGAGATRSAFSYSNTALTLSKTFSKALSVDFTLNRTGTHTAGGAAVRDTTQTNTNVQLRLSPLRNLVVTGIRTGNDVSDSTFVGRGFNSTMQTWEATYQPFQYLSLQAGMRTDDSATVGRSTLFNSQHFVGSLMLSRQSSLIFGKTHSEEPAILADQGFRTDSESLQYVTTRVLPRTDLVLSWMRLRNSAMTSETNISTWAGRTQTYLGPKLRAIIGVSESKIGGQNGGTAFDLTSGSRDLGLSWTPNNRTEVSYTLTRMSQSGRGLASDSTLSLLRFSTVLKGRLYLLAEAADNVLDQRLQIPGGAGMSIRGERLALRLNYSLGAGASMYVQYEKMRDDASKYLTRSLRFGYTTWFK